MEISVTHIQHVIYRAILACLIEFPTREGIFPFYQLGMQNLDLGNVAFCSHYNALLAQTAF